MTSEIKVPLRVELYAGDVQIALIENDAGLWQLVMQHAVMADLRQAQQASALQEPTNGR